MKKNRIPTKFVLDPFVGIEAVDHDMMAKFGFFPDTQRFPGFYVKKEARKNKSVIFIDLYGVYTIPGGILFNEKHLNTDPNKIEAEILDLIFHGLVRELDEPASEPNILGIGAPRFITQL